MFFRGPTPAMLETMTTLAQISSEAWMQSRAALYLAKGTPAQDAADAARRDFETKFGAKGLHPTHFTLDLDKP